ncbi:MAG: tetraacyldisaccharide 4'-kinase [Eudoraea sp.]|nr:tetraacyldisaccharide 4'-kinase [Eudoraea sp.]
MQLLRKIAFPISLVYAAVVYLRNYCYDIGVFKSYRFRTLTICIGNLSIGGTGKTPMIEWLLANVKTSKRVAVLSRGYRRKTKGFIKVNPTHSAEDVGDEPLQIFKKFPDTIVAVDANRRRGIAALEEKYTPDLVLLDDAFQHRKVQASLYLLLTSFNALYTRDFYLPTGNLRDSKKEAKRAQLIIVTKCPLDLDMVSQAEIIKQLNPAANQRVLFCGFEYDAMIHSTERSIELRTLAQKKVTLVTGIANAAPLYHFLESQGLIVEHMEFPDHHYFTERELKEFGTKELVITTEKDYTRMNGPANTIFCLSVKHRFLGDGKSAVLKMIDELGN